MEEPNRPVAGTAPADDPLLAPLNEDQRAAVQHGAGPLLVLAGAGSGKTRAITHRVAWLVERRGIAPWNILAVTFTNKAAGEMRERLERLLGSAAHDAHVSTFHAMGAAILRREAEKVGLTRSFVIYDDGDQMQLLRRALAESGVGDRIKPQLVRHRIDQAKNHALSPETMKVEAHDVIGIGVRKAWAHYERLLRAADAVDFGDLLLKVVELWRRDAETLDRYRRRFRWVLVDEFQDTNPVQYELLRLLCPPESANLCVVGDDDQSIYRWRGADVSNILSFEHDYPGAAVVKLERNYRSDAGILDAAYAVISRNPRRKEKRLWTDRPRGSPFDLLLAGDERGEAQQIAGWVRRVASSGVPMSEIAVFYRINAQSRVLEEGMRLAGLPYHVVRGRAFYDRAEIKDAAAYLRLAVNPRSDTDLERVINTPARGIGDTTVDRLRRHAAAAGQSLFEALARPEQIENLNAGAQRKLDGFRRLLERLAAQVRTATCAGDAVDGVLQISGLLQSLDEEGTDEAGERAENLREFAGAAREFDRLREEAGAPPPPAAASVGADEAALRRTPPAVALATAGPEGSEPEAGGDSDDAAQRGATTNEARGQLRLFAPTEGAVARAASPDVEPLPTEPAPTAASSDAGVRAQEAEASTGGGAAPAPGLPAAGVADDERGPLAPPQSALQQFLEQISLVGDADAEATGGRISLMTLHAAKGLEFDAAILSGMEEGVFPHSRATGDGGDAEQIAEERRLCYVGITRARRRLAFSLARSRALFGELRFNEPSRFLADVPRELFGFAAPASAEVKAPPGELRIERDPHVELDGGDGFEADDDFDQRPAHERRPALTVRRRTGGGVPAVGARVRHEKFGEGLVVASSGFGPNATVTVRFPGAGERRIVARFLSAAGE